tara:strand:- start:448 stop:1335 length:888 start_codon:yes stop_codon:yes gene_type:complete
MNKKNEDIDLIDLLFVLWNGKWIISLFAIIVSLFGGVFLLIKDNNLDKQKAIYESKIFYSVDVTTPVKIDVNFHNKDIVINNFQKLFYTESVFENWKKNNTESVIEYKDFKTTTTKNDIIVLKNDSENFITFKSDINAGFYIIIEFEKMVLLNDIFSYANHVSNVITLDHLNLSKSEKIFIEKKNLLIEESLRNYNSNNLKNLSSQNINALFGMGSYFSNSLDMIHTIDKYINNIEKGAKAIIVMNPTEPIRKNIIKSLKFSYTILLILAFLGVCLGSFFVIVFNSINNYKKNKI